MLLLLHKIYYGELLDEIRDRERAKMITEKEQDSGLYALTEMEKNRFYITFESAIGKPYEEMTEDDVQLVAHG